MARNVALLTPRQIKALDALMSARSVSEAAERAGVSRRQLTRWLGDETFRRALHDAQGDATRHAARRLATALQHSVDVVTHLARHAEDEGVRLRAAQAIPAMLVELREHSDLAERVARLEGVTT